MAEYLDSSYTVLYAVTTFGSAKFLVAAFWRLYSWLDCVESSVCSLLTRFEPLYTIMYLIGPSNGTVLLHALRLDTCRAASVFHNFQISLPDKIYADFLFFFCFF